MLEMSYTIDHGIPHSTWLEKWSPDDRSKVVAYLLEQTERCDMCGTAPWEWEENKFAYEAVDTFCQGCYLKSVYSDSQTSSLPGTNVELVPYSPMRAAERAVREGRRRKIAAEARREQLERSRDDRGAAGAKR